MPINVTVKLRSGIFQPGTLRRELKAAVNRTALAIEAEAKLRIKQGPKTGRAYRRASIKRAVGAKREREFRGRGLRHSRTPGAEGKFVVGYTIHRASASGESPADDTGHLANSIRATPAQADERGVRASVIVGANYGRRLEEEMNRPYLAPAVEQAAPQFFADVNAAVAGTLK